MSENAKKRVLFLANGHGEDLMAARILDRMVHEAGERLALHAWPMVGRGRAFRKRGVPLVGLGNRLPSEGFATRSFRLMARDLAAGWVGTHLAQARFAAGLSGQYDLLVAVGDVVPLAASVLARTPFFFVGCAKSEYYTWKYTALEIRLMRRAILAFARDPLTHKRLEKRGVRSRYCGMPFMDGLEPSGEGFGISPGRAVIGLLPGSRSDVLDNAVLLLKVLARVGEQCGAPPVTGLVAAVEGLDENALACAVRQNRLPGWSLEPPDPEVRGAVLALVHENRARALVVKGRFPDVLHESLLVAGLAGTANEQALGLGRPVVTFPAKGIMGRGFVRMKMELFGPAAIRTRPAPQSAARAVCGLLNDPAKRARMGDIGRARMGGPGASGAMARAILDHLERAVP